MNFCTYFDINYIHRGLALYYSLERHTTHFTLWILCLDKKTYQLLSTLNLTNAELIQLEEFEKDDDKLSNAQYNRSRVEYYWTCTPSLPLYIFKSQPNVKSLCYLDADVFFFNDPRHVFEALGTGSIFIVPHDYDEKIFANNCPSGRFNVGVMVFRHDKIGSECLNRWRGQCIEWCHHESDDGKWGDQGYLDEWPGRYDGLVVSNSPGIQAAPWNIGKYELTLDDKERLLLNGTQLVCYHFHALRMIGSRTAVSMEGHRYMNSMSRNYIYKPYILRLTEAMRRLQGVGYQVDTRLNFELIKLIVKKFILIGPFSNIIMAK